MEGSGSGWAVYRSRREFVHTSVNTSSSQMIFLTPIPFTTLDTCEGNLRRLIIPAVDTFVFPWLWTANFLGLLCILAKSDMYFFKILQAPDAVQNYGTIEDCNDWKTRLLFWWYSPKWARTSLATKTERWQDLTSHSRRCEVHGILNVRLASWLDSAGYSLLWIFVQKTNFLLWFEAQPSGQALPKPMRLSSQAEANIFCQALKQKNLWFGW